MPTANSQKDASLSNNNNNNSNASSTVVVVVLPSTTNATNFRNAEVGSSPQLNKQRLIRGSKKAATITKKEYLKKVRFLENCP